MCIAGGLPSIIWDVLASHLWLHNRENTSYCSAVQFVGLIWGDSVSDLALCQLPISTPCNH